MNICFPWYVWIGPGDGLNINQSLLAYSRITFGCFFRLVITSFIYGEIMSSSITCFEITGGNKKPFFKCRSIISSGDWISHLIKPKTSSFLIAWISDRLKNVTLTIFDTTIRMCAHASTCEISFICVHKLVCTSSCVCVWACAKTYLIISFQYSPHFGLYMRDLFSQCSPPATRHVDHFIAIWFQIFLSF